MAKLPKAVQAQVERVNELTAEEVETTEETTTPEETPVVEPEVVEEVEQVVEQEGLEPAPVEKDNREEYWEQRLRTVQGMHDADRRRAKEEADAQAARVKELEAAMKLLKKESKPEFDLSDVLTPDELELHDKDTLDLVRRSAAKAARIAAEDVLEEVDNRMTPFEDKIKAAEETTRIKAEELFWKSVTASVPDWKTINADPKWLQWLAQTDPIYGVERQALLNDARGNLDADRVAAIFNKYKEGAVTRPSKEKKVVADPLADTVDTSVVEGVSRSEITRFYKDKALGKVRPDDVVKFEKRLKEAYAAGSIN